MYQKTFRCGWCTYISYRRNVVERHMKEKHPTKKAFDFVIREPDEADGQKKQEEKISEVYFMSTFENEVYRYFL